MIYPITTFAGQKVSICNRYIELFRQEANQHSSGVQARALRAELNALMPEAYHGHRLIWLRIKWNDVLKGNAELGFPAIDLDKRSLATSKKDETYKVLNTFYKYQREEKNPTVKALLHERHKAMEECRQDTTHNPKLSDFERVNGKMVLNLPSKNPMNESTNIAFIMRAMGTLDSTMDNEYRQAASEALAAMKQKGYDSTRWDVQLNKEFVRRNINLPEPPDPMENFTTYTEVDPNSRISVTSSTITAIGIARNEDAYIYSDKDPGHFSSDFTHLFTATMDNNINVGNITPWALTNDIDDSQGLLAANKSFFYTLYNNSTVFYLVESDGGTPYFDLTSLVEGTTYYYTIERDESIGFGQLNCEIFSDSDRTVSVDILSVLLHAKLDLRYIFALMSYNDSQPGRIVDLTVSNLDLGEEVTDIAILRRRMEGV